jgi:hypothetical protein
MATPAEAANDLDAHARRLDRTGHDQLVISLKRGAATIRALMKANFALEKEATERTKRRDEWGNGGCL